MCVYVCVCAAGTDVEHLMDGLGKKGLTGEETHTHIQAHTYRHTHTHTQIHTHSHSHRYPQLTTCKHSSHVAK